MKAEARFNAAPILCPDLFHFAHDCGFWPRPPGFCQARAVFKSKRAVYGRHRPDFAYERTAVARESYPQACAGAVRRLHLPPPLLCIAVQTPPAPQHVTAKRGNFLPLFLPFYQPHKGSFRLRYYLLPLEQMGLLPPEFKFLQGECFPFPFPWGSIDGETETAGDRKAGLS